MPQLVSDAVQFGLLATIGVFGLFWPKTIQRYALITDKRYSSVFDLKLIRNWYASQSFIITTRVVGLFALLLAGLLLAELFRTYHFNPQ